MTLVFLCALGFGTSIISRAATPDAHDAQVHAAVCDAVARMRADIETQTLSPDLTIADFLKTTQSREQFKQALEHADQIGGPRWMDNDTCQVKLAIDSSRVKDALVKIAEASGRESPLPPDAIEAKLRVWDDRTFTATGTSISAQRAQILRPMDLSGPWRLITDEARRKAIVEARDDAINRVLESIGSIEIAGGKTVDQALSDEGLGESMRRWIANRPVTRLEFKDDLSIEITIAAEPHELFEAFCQIASKSDLVSKDPIKLAKLRQLFQQQAAPAIGVARVDARPNATMAQATRIGRQPPPWINAALKSDATAKFKDSRLKTARAAENAALDSLREKVNALQISSGTIGEAAKHDPAIERAVQQAMGRAKAYKIDYLPDGSASVKVSLDPRDLWDELRELP